jgi:hypothetical protein
VRYKVWIELVIMLPDPRWEEALSSDQLVSRPCRCIEMISRKDDEAEVISGDLTADDVLPWLNGQVSGDRLCSGQYTDTATFHP